MSRTSCETAKLFSACWTTLTLSRRPPLRRHARIQLNCGKTRVWNAAGEEPTGIAELQSGSEATIRVGDWSLPQDQQGLVVLGTPLGSDAFVQGHLLLNRAEHDCLPCD